MQPITFPTSKYIILHGHANTPDPVLLDYTPPSKVWTAQPNVEDFDDAQAAITRAIELGVAPLLTTEFWPHDKALSLATKQLVDLPDPIPAWDAATTYQSGDVVTYTLTEDVDGETLSTELLFLKVSDTHPSVPDMTFDLEAGTGDWVAFDLKPAPAPPTAEAKLAALETA